MVSYIEREREIGKDDATSESIAMSSAKAEDLGEVASCAGVGHRGEQGRERGGEEGQGICVKRETSEGAGLSAKRDQMTGVWVLCKKAEICVILENGLQIFWV